MRITTEAELREVLGEPGPRSVLKERKTLHERDKQWLAASSFCLIGTAAADGTCDVSPKGDPAGFVHVIDDTTIVIPERPGNRRGDGYSNIVSNPHIGLLFIIPGRTDTLRVNGKAHLVTDAPYFEHMVVKGHRPILAIVVEIEQVFYHCSKAFLRSDLWQPQTWQPDLLPSRARIVKDTQPTTETLEELEEAYGPAYLKGLYEQVN
jgi:PPOX class probable FMN-dependent enzyme